jgi:hypothetical protein
VGPVTLAMCIQMIACNALETRALLHRIQLYYGIHLRNKP